MASNKMNLEIERKFLCSLTREQAKSLATGSRKIHSVYFKNTPEETFRVVKDKYESGHEHFFWTVKKSTEHSSVRQELERPLDREVFDQLSSLNYPEVKKERFIIPFGDYNWEIDFFEDYDFVIAELEFKLKKEADNFSNFPEWVIKEVTDDPYYLNCNLAKSF